LSTGKSFNMVAKVKKVQLVSGPNINNLLSIFET